MKNPYTNVRKQLAKDKSLCHIDIETSPHVAFTWSLGPKVSIPYEFLIEEGKVITITYKFEGDKKCTTLTWNPKTQDDSQMLKKFVTVINKCKVILGQNSDNFDIKTLNWRLNLLNLTPMAELVTLDTLKLSRNSFRAPSHKQDHRAKQYGFGGKIKMTFQDWKDTIDNKPGALEKMCKYNVKDVEDMQKMFWKELPYYKSLPISLAKLVGKDRTFCPRCADKRQRKYDIYCTKWNNKLRFKCNNCNHIWKDSRSI